MAAVPMFATAFGVDESGFATSGRGYPRILRTAIGSPQRQTRSFKRRSYLIPIGFRAGRECLQCMLHGEIILMFKQCRDVLFGLVDLISANIIQDTCTEGVNAFYRL